jgi:D-glycero-D-manno-heptose 1,7-bisphosphate phosphatase
VGGRGTRLGGLTDSTPKPLLTVGDRPFLDHLIGESIRFGADRILLLCGYRASNIADHYAGRRFAGAELGIVVETEPAGTGGALRNAAAQLDDAFFLTNGDSCFDINWLDLPVWEAGNDWVGRMALRAVPPGGRYGRVTLDDGRVTAFHAAAADLAGPMNAGLYVLRRSVLDWIDKVPCSLEQDVFPRLAAAGLLRGRVYDGFFLDIGVPEDFARAQTEVPACLRRPAAFLPLAGVISHDGGRAAVKLLNDHGYYVFMIAGPDDGADQGRISKELRAIGAHVDDMEVSSANSVPALRCLESWPVSRHGSFVVAVRQDDLDTMATAGLPGYLFSGGSLFDLAAAQIQAAGQLLTR